ncbi:hypothetical protein MUGA111182_00110 [Mucilaginibacter galii]
MLQTSLPAGLLTSLLHIRNDTQRRNMINADLSVPEILRDH